MAKRLKAGIPSRDMKEINNIKVETDGHAGALIVCVAFDQVISVVDDEGRR